MFFIERFFKPLMSIMIKYFFLSVLLLSSTFCHSKIIEEEIQLIMDKYNAIGLSVAVVRDNNVCYMGCYGYNPSFSKDECKDSIPADGIYWLASVSKTFISTAIMQLVERKKMYLDDNINKYLDFEVVNPYYPDVPITIRMLLSHRSSINDSQYGRTFEMFDVNNPNYNGNFNNQFPGTCYFYCNMNYSLLGAIIEKVSKNRFYEYIDRNICKPLKINGSFNVTQMDSSKIVKSLFYNHEKHSFYHVDNDIIYDCNYVSKCFADYRLGYSAVFLCPSGGMWMTVKDLSKWMIVHMNYGKYRCKRVLKKKTEMEMWKPQGSDHKYGFAFMGYDSIILGDTLYGMTGGSHGYHSAMYFNPMKKYGFALICNGCSSKSANGSEMNNEIVQLLYNYFIK